jgi:hypothetical protein
MGFHHDCATHSGILTSLRSTNPHGLASQLENAPLPFLSRKKEIPSFGTRLKPRYVVGATTLDQ